MASYRLSQLTSLPTSSPCVFGKGASLRFTGAIPAASFGKSLPSFLMVKVTSGCPMMDLQSLKRFRDESEKVADKHLIRIVKAAFPYSEKEEKEKT